MTFLAPVPTARCAAARRKTSPLATAFVLAWAWEMSGGAGKIRLDDPAARYLAGLTGSASRITLRQLLSHTSGLPMAHPALQRRDITLSQGVDAIVAAPLMHEPGEACVYGDVSVQVAGRIAEIASGVGAPSGQAWKRLFASRLATTGAS